jgi:hypothetical protein
MQNSASARVDRLEDLDFIKPIKNNHFSKGKHLEGANRRAETLN